MNVWETLLSDVGKGSVVEKSTVVVLGDRHVGKRSLVAKLHKAEMVNEFKQDGAKALSQTQEKQVSEYISSRSVSLAGLGYTYLEPSLEDDLSVKVDVWVLEDPKRAERFLEFALPDIHTIRHAVAVIAVDLTTPWRTMDSLKRWSEVLEAHVKGVVEKTNSPGKELYANIQTYTDNIKDMKGKELLLAPEDPAAAPMESDKLEHNLGIPVLVVGTKSEFIVEASDDTETELRLEFIQRHLRNFCLSHGASLTYTSARSESNLDVFYKYLLHRLYPSMAPVRSEPVNSEAPFIQSQRESIHVPVGWDHVELIKTLANTQNQSIVFWTPETPYSEVIVEPAASKKKNEGDLETDDESVGDEEAAMIHQEFLAKLLAKQKLIPDAVRAHSTDAASSALKAFNANASSLKTGISDAPSIPMNAQRPASPVPSSDSGATGRSTSPAPSGRRVTAQDAKENPALIANFFQNLLNRDKMSESPTPDNKQ
mmetsp:Transcript_7642/g.12363  ORF Transcript_7642/g.12363 Transcript_7642/m.12363 type:complete len:483 (-) Transcript_7642:26-1474(-)